MEKNHLKEFMENVPTRKYKGLKDSIVEKCAISNDTWLNWLSGRTAIPELAKSVINSLAGEEVFEARKKETTI